MKLILSFDSKLLVPSSLEFMLVFLTRLEDLCNCDEQCSLMLDELPEWTSEYLQYLEKDFTNIEFNQSEKALACCFCAVARWSIKAQQFTSTLQEAEAMRLALEVLLEESAPTGYLVNHSVLRLHAAWRTVVAHKDLRSICRVRCRFIARRIISADDFLKESSDSVVSLDKENIAKAVPLSQPGNDVNFISTANTAPSPHSEVKAANIVHKNVDNTSTPQRKVCPQEKENLKNCRVDRRQQHQIKKANIGQLANASSYSPKATSDLFTEFEEEHGKTEAFITKKRSASWSAGGDKRVKC